MAGPLIQLESEDKEQHEDYMENYVEIEDDDDDNDMGGEASNTGAQSSMDGGIVPEGVLSNMFDNDASDPGYQTLLWYLSRRRRDQGDTDVAVERIPCRRCLRAGVKCRKVNGPEAPCESCAKPAARAHCISDLRGAELYHGVTKYYRA